VSTESQVMALLEAGNPATEVEDAAWSELSAAEHLAVLEERGSAMTKLVKDPRERAGGRRSVGWAAAAIVAVVLGIGVLFISQRQSEVAQPPATTVAPDVAAGEPEATARRFIDARNMRDGEAAIALFAPDAVISGDFAIAGAEDYPALFSWFQATDWRWTVEECSVTMAGPPAEVTCTSTQENAWSRALQVEGTGSFDFTTSNGQILKLHNNVHLDFDSPVVGQFFQWVLTTHPEDKEVLYLAGSRTSPNLTAESIALWEEYTNEFVASVTDSSTP